MRTVSCVRAGVGTSRRVNNQQTAAISKGVTISHVAADRLQISLVPAASPFACRSKSLILALRFASFQLAFYSFHRMTVNEVLEGIGLSDPENEKSRSKSLNFHVGCQSGTPVSHGRQTELLRQ
jgi:hypothetical protein